MDFRDLVRSGLDEYLEGLEQALDGLTPVELAWQPAPSSNNITWQVWHMARVEDRWVNSYLRQATEVWIVDKWYSKFGLQPEDHGARQTAEDAAAMPDLPLAGLMDYYRVVRDSTNSYVDSLTADDLGKSYSHPRTNPGPTVNWVLAHLLVEEAQHLGQVAYVRGMLRGLGN